MYEVKIGVGGENDALEDYVKATDGTRMTLIERIFADKKLNGSANGIRLVVKHLCRSAQSASSAFHQFELKD